MSLDLDLDRARAGHGPPGVVAPGADGPRGGPTAAAPGRAPIPAPRCPRYRSLDLWRGAACLLVLVHHSAPGPVGPPTDVASLVAAVAARMWVGVPLFFVISGYCIAATADSTRRRPRALATYFLRRFRRIYPPYWILIGLTVALLVVVDVLLLPRSLTSDGPFLRPWWLSTWQWLGNLTLTEIWRHHVVGGPKSLFLGHAWTLCYEEQFYVVTGALLLVAPRRFFAAAAVVTATSLAAAAAAARLGLAIDGFFFDGGWTLFAAGILVYYRINYATRAGRIAADLTLAAALAYAASDPARLLEVSKNREQGLVVAAGFALLLGLLHRWDARLASAAALRPLMACGLMCYSLYLVHLPIIRFLTGGLRYAGLRGDALSPLATIPAFGTTCIAAAWAFHRAVERRFLNPPQGRGA